jgi:phospholipid/cholesterol/gamma-HCH transport system substrate-binding protein
MPEASRIEDEETAAPGEHGVEFRATLLLVLTFALVVAFAGYVLYARGTFETTRRLVLMASNSEGVSVGADLTFSGFPVGRVKRIDLAPTGQARIEIDIPESDARWLRASSVFTLERGLVGGARLRAFTGNLDDAPLPDGAVRAVLRGDTTDELPALIANTNRVLENLQRMTASDSDLNRSLAGASAVIERVGGRHGALAALLGSDDEAARVVVAIDRANRLLASLDQLANRVDVLARKAGTTLEKADARVFGDGGLVEETQRSAAQLTALLEETRATLRKADAVLVEAQRIGANAGAASEDLVALRAEVEATLRRAGRLIEELERKWPFRRDTELRLP